jgi:hypothetical protein
MLPLGRNNVSICSVTVFASTLCDYVSEIPFNDEDRIWTLAMSVHCCDRMDEDLNQKCDQHKNRYDCPDNLITVNRGRYGLIIHDGGPSYIKSAFVLGAVQNYQPNELRLPVENADVSNNGGAL